MLSASTPPSRGQTHLGGATNQREKFEGFELLLERLGCYAGGLFFLGCQLFAQSKQASYLDYQRRIIEIFRDYEDAVVRVVAAYPPAENAETASGKAQNGDAQEDDSNEVQVPRIRVGTGFFISRDGLVLVNASRVFEARRIWLVHNGLKYAATALGHDTVNNVSLLRAIDLPPEFSIIPMDATSEPPPIGAQLLGIATILNFEPGPVTGMVLGYDNEFEDAGFGRNIFPTTWMRVSIPTQPGSGGAPLIDLNGRLVGMLVAALPDLEGSYALPTRAIIRIRDDLLFSGEVNYSWIGIEVEEQIDRETGARRVVIDQVVRNTPAATTNMQSGDIIRRIGDFEIEQVSDVTNASFFTRAGQFTTIEVARPQEGGGVETYEFTFRVIERPEGESRPVVQSGKDQAGGSQETQETQLVPPEPPDAAPVQPKEQGDTSPAQAMNPVGPPPPDESD